MKKKYKYKLTLSVDERVVKRFRKKHPAWSLSATVQQLLEEELL